MSPLSYLLFTRFKNQIKGVFRSPAKLIYAVILIALLVLVIVGGGKGAAEMEEFRPASELYAIVLGFYALMLILIVNSGFSTGMSVFKMPDVNFLFAGPFRPLRVLFFGMLQQLGTAILTGLFIIFQYGWMHGSYGVSVPGMIAILLGYSFVLFTGQLTAMTIYCLTSGSDKKRRTARGVFIGVCVIWAAYIFCACLGEGEFLSKLCAAASSSYAMYFPVAGWLCWAVAGVIEGELTGLIGLALWAVFCLALWLAMAKADQDYYNPRRRPLMLRPLQRRAASPRRGRRTSSWAARALAGERAHAFSGISTGWRTGVHACSSWAGQSWCSFWPRWVSDFSCGTRGLSRPWLSRFTCRCSHRPCAGSRAK